MNCIQRCISYLLASILCLSTIVAWPTTATADESLVDLPFSSFLEALQDPSTLQYLTEGVDIDAFKVKSITLEPVNSEKFCVKKLYKSCTLTKTFRINPITGEREWVDSLRDCKYESSCDG